MPIKLANNASGTLATAINASDTGIALTTGDGAEFPTLAASDYFYATITSTAGTQEIVKVTARSGDSLTVVRAQEGTTAAGFAVGSRFELRVTAASVDDIVEEVRTELAASSGSALVGFLQAGTGAVATTVQAALRRTVSVKDFGAVGNGVADDTLAVQTALNYFVANRVDLVFPPGVYKITSPLTAIAATNKTDSSRIVGYGATIQGALTSSGILFKVGVSGALWRSFTIEGLLFKGATNETDLLYIDGGLGGSSEYVYGFALNRVHCDGFPGNGITITRNAFEATLFSCTSRTSNTTGYPIYINYGAGAVSSISLLDCTTSGGKIGVYAPSPGSDYRVWGGTYILAQEDGMKIENAIGGQITNAHFEQNWEGAASLSAGGAGLNVALSQTFTISGVVGTSNNKQKYVVSCFASNTATGVIIGGSYTGVVTKYARLEGTNSAATDARGFVIIGGQNYDVVGTPQIHELKGDRFKLGYTNRKTLVTNSGAATLRYDPRNGNSTFFIHQTGNLTIKVPNAYTPEEGDEIEYVFEQGGSGGYTVTWDAKSTKTITNAVNNGSGLIRVTATAHGFSTDDQVQIRSVGGVTAANGTWKITVIDADTFDLVGSAFSGSYTSGGSAIKTGYMVNWTPGTTYGRRNSIKFRYTGSSSLLNAKQWVQVSSAVDLV